MNNKDYLKGIKSFLDALENGSVVKNWTYIGKTDKRFGTPGGAWSNDIYQFKDNDTILHIVAEPDSEYIVIESPTRQAQSANINFKTYLKGTNLIDPYTMTLGQNGKIKKEIIKNLSEKFGRKSNIISDLSSNLYEEHINNILDWAKNREEIKIEILSNKEKYIKNNTNNIDTNDNTDLNIKYKQPKSLNQILYGPPGTGKTYNTINKALKIIFNQNSDCAREPENIEKQYEVSYSIKDCNSEIKKVSYKEAFEEDDRIALKHIFEHYKEQGQIEFVTFHQSYGYEEFVEGIKAIPAGKEGNTTQNMIYDVVDGIFKNLSDIAKVNYEKSSVKTDDEIKEEIGIDELLNSFNKHLISVFENGEEYKLKGKATIKDLNSQNGYELGGSVSSATLSPKIIKRDYLNFKNGLVKTEADITPSRQSKQQSIGNSNYYFALLEKLKEWESKQNITFPSIVEKELLKNYILIIDEINRGNISKIFGELITLIEPSKRIGADEEIILRLPNSQDSFGVPANLYIIGTMNTADRSIAQIDTALRRRFVFEEMMPEAELLIFDNDKNRPLIIKSKDLDSKEVEINVQKILEAINERIEYIYDREHTIGHSYFMDLLKEGCNTKAKLDEIFRVNIIPLLAEYFYGDWNDIKIILNDDNDYFITENEKPKYKIIDKSRKNNKIYTINKPFKDGGYENIYYSKSDETQEEATNS